MLIFNVQILRYVGETGLVVYSIISNSVLIANSFFNGVSPAVQPLTASNFGAHKIGRVHEFRRIAVITVGIFGILFTAIGLAFPGTIIDIFVVSTPDIMTMGQVAIRLYFTALIFMSLNILLITYLQSTLKALHALILSLLQWIYTVHAVYIYFSDGLWHHLHMAGYAMYGSFDTAGGPWLLRKNDEKEI